MKKRVLFCGSRGFRNGDVARTAIRDAFDPPSPGDVLVHGDARGADRLAAAVAGDMGIACEAHPADWASDGRAAGVVRNARMIATRPTLVVALWDGRSHGTLDTIQRATQAGIPVWIYPESLGCGS